MNGELELVPSIQYRRARSPRARQDVAASRSPLGEGPHDPRVALAERSLDLANRHPPRRADRESIEPDLHSDRAAAGSNEPVVDALIDEHDAARLTVGATILTAMRATQQIAAAKQRAHRTRDAAREPVDRITPGHRRAYRAARLRSRSSSRHPPSTSVRPVPLTEWAFRSIR